MQSDVKSERGAVLIVALAVMVVAVALAYSAVSVTTVERKDIQRDEQQFEARALSEAGVHRALSYVSNVLHLNAFDPMKELDQALTTPTGGAYTLTPEEALARNGRQYGTFSVTIAVTPNGGARDLTITSTGYVPNLAAARAKATTQAIVRISLSPGKVFDYSYFINNWGWFYGDSINSYGNAAANGQFDSGGYAPSVFGTPRYSSMSLANPLAPDLVGYIDDNHDGVTDGTDGGIFAGWDIVNAARVRGMGGQAQNQHPFQQQTPMPNLNDLSTYETLAKNANASISLGGGTDAFGNPLPPVPVCNAVLGDEPGELSNLVLIGTTTNPIILNGPVVVRGSVIIKGVVTGQGAIYSGGNVYIADNLTYKNPPTTWLPAGESEAQTEAWLATNASKDFCGLFAKEHVVMGNYEDWLWRMFVGWWLADPMNASAEDAGADLIPNTRYGRDGIANTADDDVLEGDGIWTVQHYTQADADLGLLPPGKNVGDPVPGTGEDIDGDGQYDGTTTLNDFTIPAPLDTAHWAGNLPPGVSTFTQLSSMTITDVNAALYTNHAAGLVTLAWGQDFHLFGSIVSRNESLIYGTNSMNMYYDRRLEGGGEFGPMLPRTLAPFQILAWQRIENDVQAQIANP